MFSKNEFYGTTLKIEYPWKCLKCNKIFYAVYPKNGRAIRCTHCFPIKSNKSFIEKELIDFCKEYYPNLIENDRTLISPKELDIVIPELKLAIEFNRFTMAFR